MKNEKDPGLKKRLKSLAADLDFEGTEEEKNRKLAPVDYVPPEGEEESIERPPSMREDDKHRSGRAASEERE